MRFRSSVRILFTVGLLVGSLALFGCPKRPEVGQAPPSAPGPGAVVAPAAPSPTTAPPEVRVQPPAATAVVPEAPKAPETVVAVSPLKDAFFDFDKSALREDQKAALNEDVAWLKGNAGAKVLIEGHCDERGTAEYNLGLGERRAKAVKDYLIAAGVAADRISIISYGKERPFVLGHDESAWKWNRRGHFVLQGK
ncbi:MAG: peptidoglycan-associated lipoprotein Pal [candidate division NC10 bacterium]|nr:peptidoglycan-associated lipoprotein Pal [candidate division NC10 bacterium]